MWGRPTSEEPAAAAAEADWDDLYGEEQSSDSDFGSDGPRVISKSVETYAEQVRGVDGEPLRQSAARRVAGAPFWEHLADAGSGTALDGPTEDRDGDDGVVKKWHHNHCVVVYPPALAFSAALPRGDLGGCVRVLVNAAAAGGVGVTPPPPRSGGGVPRIWLCPPLVKAASVDAAAATAAGLGTQLRAVLALFAPPSAIEPDDAVGLLAVAAAVAVGPRRAAAVAGVLARLADPAETEGDRRWAAAGAPPRPLRAVGVAAARLCPSPPRGRLLPPTTPLTGTRRRSRPAWRGGWARPRGWC